MQDTNVAGRTARPRWALAAGILTCIGIIGC
jgi:hypothetical protein